MKKVVKFGGSSLANAEQFQNRASFSPHLSILNHNPSACITAAGFHASTTANLQSGELYKAIRVFCTFQGARHFACKTERTVLAAEQIAFSRLLMSCLKLRFFHFS